MQGGGNMCRKNLTIGIALAAFGAGLLVASFFETPFFCGCLGLMIMVAGVVILKKR
jgi:hypothetical protein